MGYGRVGEILPQSLLARGADFTLIEEPPNRVDEARTSGFEVVTGNATQVQALEQAGLAAAARLLVAIPEGFEAGGIVDRARDLNPHLTIVARAHSNAEAEDLTLRGADQVILGEKAIAQRMLDSPPASRA